MTDRATLAALVARVEAATEPDRELDAAIALAAGKAPQSAFLLVPPAPLGVFATGPYTFWEAPHYTASLDAAASLVPKGWHWELLSRGAASCWRPGHFAGAVKTATPALALIAAALRAMMETMDD